MTDLSALESDLSSQISEANDLSSLDAVRVHALGKKGVISEQMKTPVSYTHLTLPTKA